jgi:hypothetical protein
MFRPYKAIIRHLIKEFYPTALFIYFHVAYYYLSIFYFVARPFSVYVGALVCVSCSLRFLSSLYSYTLPLHFFLTPNTEQFGYSKEMQSWVCFQIPFLVVIVFI